MDPARAWYYHNQLVLQSGICNHVFLLVLNFINMLQSRIPCLLPQLDQRERVTRNNIWFILLSSQVFDLSLEKGLFIHVTHRCEVVQISLFFKRFL